MHTSTHTHTHTTGGGCAGGGAGTDTPAKQPRGAAVWLAGWLLGAQRGPPRSAEPPLRAGARRAHDLRGAIDRRSRRAVPRQAAPRRADARHFSPAARARAEGGAPPRRCPRTPHARRGGRRAANKLRSRAWPRGARGRRGRARRGRASAACGAARGYVPDTSNDPASHPARCRPPSTEAGGCLTPGQQRGRALSSALDAP